MKKRDSFNYYDTSEDIIFDNESMYYYDDVPDPNRRFDGTMEFTAVRGHNLDRNARPLGEETMLFNAPNRPGFQSHSGLRPASPNSARLDSHTVSTQSPYSYSNHHANPAAPNPNYYYGPPLGYQMPPGPRPAAAPQYPPMPDASGLNSPANGKAAYVGSEAPAAAPYGGSYPDAPSGPDLVPPPANFGVPTGPNPYNTKHTQELIQQTVRKQNEINHASYQKHIQNEEKTRQLEKQVAELQKLLTNATHNFTKVVTTLTNSLTTTQEILRQRQTETLSFKNEDPDDESSVTKKSLPQPNGASSTSNNKSSK